MINQIHNNISVFPTLDPAKKEDTRYTPNVPSNTQMKT